MAALSIQMERRQYAREGLIAHLEDITYAALRRCCTDIMERVNSVSVLQEYVMHNENGVSIASLTALSEKPSIS